MLARAIAKSIGCVFRRIQFTPDMLPSDVTGVSVFNQKTREFEFRPGPVMAQIVLTDEINRATPKTQSALLEVMEEKQVTVDGVTYPMEGPFLVMATQNPIEYEGTYPLPEAQLDRFLFKVLVPYSPLDTEVEVLRRYHNGFDPHKLAAAGLQAILPASGVMQAHDAIQQVVVEEGILTYIAQVSAASRRSPDLILGASPRASTHVLLAAKTYAALQGRDYVTPDDVKFIIPPVFRHRLLLKPEAEIEGLDADAVIRRLLGQVEVPR
jgi:MoxR-like ATPase